jgi:hypothetical protein
MIRAPYPRILSVRRLHPNRISPGDIAEARLDPGLMAILDSDLQLGAGYQPRYNVPVGLASTAANAVLAPSINDGRGWAGRDIEIEWLGLPGVDDAILAEAHLEEFTERLARFTVQGRTVTGQPLYRGTLRMMSWRDGIPTGFRSTGEFWALRARLSEARTPPLEPVGTDKSLRLIAAPPSIPLGKSAIVEVEVSNRVEHPASIEVTAHPPHGAGLSFDSPPVRTISLNPGESARVQFSIRADRPHEVNLGKPWELEISAAGETISVPIQIPDPNPGRTFYLLTEDCETFDGGPLTGDYASYGMAHFGNQNNFMDPEDYRIQMIRKPNRINQIAERHGAKWTHFYAATQRFGAEWAATQSNTGEWPKVLEEMDESVRAGAKLHEYSPHIHFDYEPKSALPPQPRLIYDAATDGIIPNDYYHPETNPTHRYHDWDGSARGHSYIKTLGDWTDLETKTGSMRKSLLHLARLQANRRTPLVSRTGSHDFGKEPQDQAISTQAYAANGLRGNSDAYRPGAPPTPGGQMFWCTEHDRQQPIANLRQAQLVQFGIAMDSLFPSAEEVNQWFADHWQSTQGPGVHALLFTTHAMLMRGEPDPFRSLEGGVFHQLDRHLAWVRENYPGVEFATATEAVLEYLDYYTPALEAHTETLLCGGDPPTGRYEFPIRLLGRGIRIGEEHPATVQIAAPPCLSPQELLEMRILQDGRVIATRQTFDPKRQPVITVPLTSRAPLRLEVLLRPETIAAAQAWFRESSGEIIFHEPAEPARPGLFRVRPPIATSNTAMRFSSDLIRFLMNPVAGHAEPLGRRIHPLGGFTIGMALTAALHAAGEENTPVRLKLRWLHEVDLDSGFVTETNGTNVQIRNDKGTLVADAEVTLKSTAID